MYKTLKIRTILIYQEFFGNREFLRVFLIQTKDYFHEKIYSFKKRNFLQNFFKNIFKKVIYQPLKMDLFSYLMVLTSVVYILLVIRYTNLHICIFFLNSSIAPN